MLKTVPQRLARRVALWRYRPAVEVERSPQLIRLGSDYGGWSLEPSSDLWHSTIISCGLGEDASFDVEFAHRFNARVIMVDPTPRAVEHYHEITEHLGECATRSYVRGGKQDIGCYELQGLDDSQLVLEPYAIWNKHERLRFFGPSNPDYVSHSIVNFEDEYSSTYIEVDAVTIDELMSKHHLRDIPLIKLDVEGAEVEVIHSILDRGVRPRQFLVEFDEINQPGPRSKQRIEETDRALHAAGYACRNSDGSNFLYILN